MAYQGRSRKFNTIFNFNSSNLKALEKEFDVIR